MNLLQRVPGGLVKTAAPSIEKQIDGVPSKSVSSVRQSKFLSDKMVTMLNRQLGIELFSAIEYLMAAAWFQSKGLAGFQCWMDEQGQGELAHAQKVYKFLMETGSTIAIPAIPAVDVSWKKVPEVTRAVLDHEMFVTSCWKDIAKLAQNEENPASLKLAQEFLEEQIEEEDNSLTLHQKVEMADTGTGILVVDSDLKEFKPAQGKEASEAEVYLSKIANRLTTAVQPPAPVKKPDAGSAVAPAAGTAPAPKAPPPGETEPKALPTGTSTPVEEVRQYPDIRTLAKPDDIISRATQLADKVKIPVGSGSIKPTLTGLQYERKW